MADITLTISEEALRSGEVKIENVPAGFNPEAAAATETGTFDYPSQFSATLVPIYTTGMITGGQHPGYDSIYGVNYGGFATGWYLQRKNDGTLYFTNASWTEYMDCPFLPPPNPTSINYPVANLPTA